MEQTPVIEIRGVSFAYNGETILEDVNLAIGPREFISVVGPNGGGKTTLLKLVVGLLEPTAGTVRVFGLPPRDARRRIGYLPQHAQMDPRFPASVADVVLTGRLGPDRRFGLYGKADREAAGEALRDVDLCDLGRRPYAELSGGQRQRVLIARALVSRPDLLLLDEPTAGLDAHMESGLFDLLKVLNERLTIVLVTHDLGFVSQVVRSVACVRRKVVVHPTSEVTGEMIREIYGGDVRMIRHDHRCDEGGHSRV